MYDRNPDPAATELLRQEFDLPRGSLTEAELLEWLSARVAELLRLRPEYLMSLCYTLDLPEAEVNAAMELAGEAPHRALAALLYRRQCLRVRTKRAYRSEPLTDPDAW